MDKAALITFATAMFTILNPIGNVAIFAGMMAGRPDSARRSTAIGRANSSFSFSVSRSRASRWPEV